MKTYGWKKGGNILKMSYHLNFISEFPKSRFLFPLKSPCLTKHARILKTFYINYEKNFLARQILSFVFRSVNFFYKLTKYVCWSKSCDFSAYNLPRFFEISRQEIQLPDTLHTVHDVVPTSLRQNSNYTKVRNSCQTHSTLFMMWSPPAWGRTATTSRW